MECLAPALNVYAIGIRWIDKRPNPDQFMHAIFKYFVCICFGSVRLVAQQGAGSVFKWVALLFFSYKIDRGIVVKN